MLVNHPGEDVQESLHNYVWLYKLNTTSKWGNTSSPEELIKALEKNISNASSDKITISQTNILGFNCLGGLPDAAKKTHNEVAESLARMTNWHGIISLDFVGSDELSSTSLYMEMIHKERDKFRA